jgi:beta-phosphoglucomutase-like phosphatase (HAD superfamily)
MTPETDRFDAVVFDCDGVLVNSEEIAQDVELSMLAREGLEYPRDDFVRRFSGTSEREFKEALRSDARTLCGLDLSDDFFDRMEAATRSAYAGRLARIAGAHRSVSAWTKLRAVASSSSIHTLRYKLRVAELDTMFGIHIYSGDAVEAAKPDPAIFLLAAEGLGVPPSRCVAIEDSVNGIVAAKRAGMTAYGFTGGGHCLSDHDQRLRESGADEVFSAHSKLASHLAL